MESLKGYYSGHNQMGQDEANGSSLGCGLFRGGFPYKMFFLFIIYVVYILFNIYIYMVYI